MIQIKADSAELHPYITAYALNIQPVEGDNSFTDANGNVVKEILGYKAVVSCTLEKVPHAVAQSIAAVMQKENFKLVYTTPAPASGQFCCTKYDVKPKNSDPREKNPLITEKITWTINLTLESTEYVAADSGGL